MTTDLASRIKEAREYLGPGLTREAAAAKLGCSPLLIAAIEDGTADSGPEMLARLGRLYMRPVEWFLGEFRFEPPPDLLRAAEGMRHPDDRAAFLEFAEFLQCKKASDEQP